MKREKKLKRQNGSIAVYVSIVLLSMMIVLSAMLSILTLTRKNQLTTAMKLKETYELNNKNASYIYKMLLKGNESSDSEMNYIGNGLILHYDGINNTGSGHSNTTTTWKDLSGNNNDGIITGGTWQNNLLKFSTSNESNGVKTKQNFPIDYNNTFNIVFKLSNVNDVEALFGSRSTTTDGLMLFNFNTNNSLSLDTRGSNTRIQIGERLLANTLYNITVTFSENTVKSYVNGELTKTTNFTNASLNFPLTIFTAARRSNALGEIYSVKIYNRALTNQEILQNYNVDKAKYE